MNKRQTTIHDLTTLALHLTGSRAQPYKTNALRDRRGNWIARDAGAWGDVPKRRGGRVSWSDEEEEEESDDGGEGQGKGKGQEKVKQMPDDDDDQGQYLNLKDSRARKRRKLIHDIDFLPDVQSIVNQTKPPSLPSNTTTAEDDIHYSPSVLELSIPSSDLLKQIHHFAAHYYASQNLLFDSSREYRKAKRDRKGKGRHVAANERSGPLEEDEEGGEVEEGEEEEEEDPGPSMTTNSITKSKKSTKKKNKPKRKTQKALQRDMYKLFDGSALMLLGMLLQHHTSSLLLSSQPSPAWEEEMTFGVGERPRGGTKKKRGEGGRGFKEELLEGREPEDDEGDEGSAREEAKMGFSDEEDEEDEDKLDE